MTEVGTLTGDGRWITDGQENVPKTDNAMQRWRKQRQRELEVARERRLKEEKQSMDAWGEREKMKEKDDRLSKQIAEAEWRRIRSEATMSPRSVGTQGWSEEDMGAYSKSPMSDGGTTLVRSPTRASDESEWRRRWRMMGEDELRGDDEDGRDEISGPSHVPKPPKRALEGPERH